MKKAVAIPYIIALIIGIIVVVVLAYWFISSGGKGSGIGTDAECTARKLEYCTTQTDDVLSEVRKICKEIPDWNAYCPTLIPGWKAK